ncbi:unnamed protein product [Larinioides sclopetarius]|uniref:Choline kinase n=1 Tax=Larinioides sclopetarius TaxID=280406 RepID=A0AAV2A4U1_9ARAC
MTTAPNEDLKNIKEDAYKLCQEFLGDTWGELSISEFGFSVVSGGLSNSLYRCSLPKNAAVKNSKTPRQVLLRIYGSLQEDLNAVLTGVTTFIFLAERKLGPKLYGVFPNGRLEEFIPSRTLSSKDYKVMYPAIARELAKIHALDVPVRKIPDFWPVIMKKWLNAVERDTKLKKNSTFEYLDVYTKAIEWLTGFDLANQFAEWCFDYGTDEYPHFIYSSEKFPSEEEQISYIRAYLDQLAKEGVILSTSIEEEIKVILQEIELFSMAAHLFWSLWSRRMTFHSSMGFTFEEYSNTRLDAFCDIRKKYLNREMCNGDSASDH